MKILGVDPGYGRCGVGIISQKQREVECLYYGCIETKSNTNFSQRLFTIHLELLKLIDLYNPQIIAVEELFFSITDGSQLATF